MELTEVMRKKEGRIEIDVIVSPKASRSGIGGIDEWRKRLIVKVKAPPIEGKANKEVTAMFSGITGSRVEVTAGMASHQKTITVYGDLEEICAKLKPML